MKRKLILELLGIIAVFALIWWGVAQLPYFSEAPTLKLSHKKEKQLGNMLKEQFLQGEETVRSPVVDSAIHLIMSRLYKGIDTSSTHGYNITVITNDQANAFALPGGQIVVFTGLLELADKPEGVAAVIAHEMGHIQNNHVVRRLTKELGITALFTALGGNQMVIGDIVKLIVSSSFDRKQEEEADQFALQLLEEASINPRVMGTFFNKLKEETPNLPSELAIISTHPNIEDRIDRARQYNLPDDFSVVAIDYNWEKVTEALKDSSSNNHGAVADSIL